MTKIKKLIDIENILLKLESKYKFNYTLDELIKNYEYLKEIGSITNLFFSVQCEYSNTLNQSDKDFVNKIQNYQESLSSDEIDINITKYINFIIQLKNKVSDDELLSLIKNVTTTS